MKVQAIIPSAGSGDRLKSRTLKPFIKLSGKPLIVHTLERFQKCALIDGVVLVVPADKLSDFEKLIEENGLSKVSRIVAGGNSRQESVYNGLQVIDHDTDIVVVHDGARPLIDPGIIEQTIASAQKYEAAAVGVPIKPTIKRVDNETLLIEETIERNGLWEIQTPQVFKKDVLMKAHESNGTTDATDDAMLVEKLGISVKIVEGNYRNIKVTTQEDLTVAEVFLGEKH